MKHLLLLLLFPILVLADTPPPGAVRSKTYSGDGLTAIGVDGDALKVKFTNTSLTPLDPNAARYDEQQTQTSKLTSMDATLSSLNSKTTAVNTNNVTVTSNALALNAATAANQASELGVLNAINTKIPASPAQDRTTAAAAFSARLSDGLNFYKATTPADTQPVSLVAIPLATNASTLTEQQSQTIKLNNIDATTTAINGKITAVNTNSVTVISAPLPPNAATATNQVLQTSSLTSIDSKLTGVATAANQGTTNSKLTSIDNTLANLNSKVSAANTNSVTVISSPLPPNASTASNQTTGNNSLAGIDATLSTINGKIPASPSQEHVTAASPNAARLTDGTSFYKATTPADTQPVSLLAVPLATNASTLTEQQTQTTKLTSIDGKLTGVATAANQTTGNSTLSSILSALDVNLSTRSSESTLSSLNSKVTAVNTNNVTVTSNALAANASTLTEQQAQTAKLTSIDSKLTAPLQVTGSVSATVDTTGLATSAGQTTGNNSLASIDTKVSTAANQVAAKTVLDNILSALDVNLSTRASTALQTAGNSSLSSIVTNTTGIATLAEQQAQTAKLTSADNSLASIDTKLNSQATAANQVTGNSSLSTIVTNTTGLATASAQTTGNNSLSSIDAKMTSADNSLASIDSKLTSPLSVTGSTVTANLGTLNGAATAANQITQIALATSSDSSLSSINTKLTSQATAANQVTANNSLASIDSKLTSPLQITGSASATQSGVWYDRIQDVAGNGLTSTNISGKQSLDINIAGGTVSVGSVTATPPINSNVLGTITSACPTGVSCAPSSYVMVTTNGNSTMSYETHGTWDALLTTDISYDPGCNTSPSTVLWFQTASFDTYQDQSEYDVNFDSADNNHSWALNVAGVYCARLRAISYTSGTVATTLVSGVGTAAVWSVSTGNVGSGGVDSGNPVKIGAIYNSVLPNVSSGNRVDLQADSNGRLIISPLSASSTVTVAGGATAANQTTGNSTLSSILSTLDVNLSTRASTALQTTGNNSLASIDSKLTSPLTVQGSVSATVTNQIIGYATSANQTSQIAWATSSDNSLASINTKLTSQATAANQTTGNNSLASIDAKMSNGSQKSLLTGAAKGVTTSGDITSTAQSADRQGLDVQIRTSTGVAVDSFGGGQQYDTGAASGTTTGTVAMGTDGSNIRALSVDSTGKLNINNPTGAATSALQTTGNASLASIDTKLTAPLVTSGTVTANIGTTNGLALDATLTGGTAKMINRGAAKGATVAGDVTSTAQSADRQGLDVQIRTSAGVAVDTFGTQYANGAAVASASATGTVAMGYDGANVRAVKTDTSGRQELADGTIQSFSAAFVALANGSVTTDTFTLIGSATKTVKLKQVTYGCTQTTATERDIIFLKRSTADTNNSSTALTIVPLDSNNAAATAVARSRTADPSSVGTLVGNMYAFKLFISTATTNQTPLVWIATPQTQTIVLRGTAETFAINLNGVNSAGASCSGFVTWTEE